jgi:hypothetical protein
MNSPIEVLKPAAESVDAGIALFTVGTAQVTTFVCKHSWVMPVCNRIASALFY